MPGLAALLIYLPALNYPLVWDDVNLIVYNRESPFNSFRQSFWHGSSQHLGSDPYYRPLVNFSLRLDRLIAGTNAWFFHLVNILLHSIVSILLVLLIIRITGSLTGGILAGLVFALHPLFADCVAYVSGRTDLLAGLGVLIAGLGITGDKKNPFWVDCALTWFGYGMGVFSKESAVFFIFIVAGWLFLARGKWAMEYRCVLFAGMVIILAGYLIARRQILGHFFGLSCKGEVMPLILSALGNFGYQIGLFFFPWGREVFHFHPGGFVRLNGWVIIGLVYFLLPVFFLKVKHQALFILGWLWSELFLLPVAIFVSFGPSGRLLYLPALGGLLTFAVLMNSITFRTAKSRFLLVPVGCWLALSVPFLWQRMRVWGNEEILFSRMVAEASDYAPGYYNLSLILLNRGDEAGAVVLLRRAVALDSSLSIAGSNLAALLQKRGEYGEAEVILRRVLRDKPDYAQGYAHLALILLSKGNLAGAIELQKKACELAPDDPSLFYNLALLFRRQGKLDSARAAVKKAVQLAPANPRFQALLKKLR